MAVGLRKALCSAAPRFPGAVVSVPAELLPKAELDGACSSLLWWEVFLPMAGAGTRWAPRFLTTVQQRLSLFAL